MKIKDGTLHLVSEKSPGPDGFSFEFYKHCWNSIKSDLLRVVYNFYNHQVSLERINYSYIILIPKEEFNYTIRNYRLISLMNGIVKIISKVLSTRLAKKLDSMISPTQSAFIHSRTLSDNFAAAKEVISHAVASKHKGIIYKLDFEKAFDRVEWSFILDIPSARGFRSKWCRWIYDIISIANHQS